MESVFSLSCINGVIDHSGNGNIFLCTEMKAQLKLCDVKAEMHLDDLIPQNLPGESYICLSSRHLCKLKCFWRGEKSTMQFSSGLLGDELRVLKIKELMGTSAIKMV